MSVVTLTRIPSANPITAPSAIATPTLMPPTGSIYPDRIVAAARLRPRVRHRDRVDSGALWRVAVSARWRGSDPARRARWFSSSPAWSSSCSRARCCSAAVEIGLGVDDYIHALRFDQWLDSGWYVPEYLLSAGEPDPSRIDATPFVYGAAFNVLAHLLNAVLGIESIGEISTEADAYAVRHLTTALIGLATVLCVGGAVWTLTRDRLAAVWGAAALLAIPVWTGYAMFSNKDVPVAAAFTFVTFGLVLLLSWANRRPARFGGSGHGRSRAGRTRRLPRGRDAAGDLGPAARLAGHLRAPVLALAGLDPRRGAGFGAPGARLHRRPRRRRGASSAHGR